MVCQTNVKAQLNNLYLQQQKLVWSVRLVCRFYGSKKSTIVEISVVCQTVVRKRIRHKSTIVEISVVCQTAPVYTYDQSDLQQQKLVWSVRPPPIFNTHRHLQQQKLVWSVRRVKFRPTFLIYLQQQKLVWSVRRIEITKRVIINLQQQKLVWSVRPPVYIGLPFILSTIVEISVVCQTQKH